MSIRKNKAAAITTILFGIVVIASCTKKKADDATPNVSLSKDLFPIFQASCAISTDCHIGSSAANNHIDLTNDMAYTTITDRGLVYTATPAASVLYNEIATGIMPKSPYPKLTAAQIKLVLNWIQQGAKNN